MSFRDTILALFGVQATLHLPPRDDRAHDAANRETVMVAKLHLADRANDRTLGRVIAAQRDDTRSGELRRGAVALRQMLEERVRQDTLAAWVKGQDTE